MHSCSVLAVLIVFRCRLGLVPLPARFIFSCRWSVAIAHTVAYVLPLRMSDMRTETVVSSRGLTEARVSSLFCSDLWMTCPARAEYCPT